MDASKNVSHAPAAQLAIVEAFSGEKLVEERRIEEIKDGMGEPEAADDGVERIVGTLKNVNGFIDEGGGEGWEANC